MATLLGCDAIPAASACAKEARQHLPRECCGDAFEEELVSQPLPAAPAPAAEIRRSTRIARVETQEKYLDLASVPGYDPAYLMGWRLSTTGHHTVEDQPEGNTQLSTKNGWSSVALAGDSSTKRFTRAAMQRMGLLLLCPDSSCEVPKEFCPKDCCPTASCVKERYNAALEMSRSVEPDVEAAACTVDAEVYASIDAPEEAAIEEAQEAQVEQGKSERRDSTSSRMSKVSQRSIASQTWAPAATRALLSKQPRRRSTCSVSSITNSATTSTVRSLLNTKAVLEDLEGSEEYEYGRLLPILLEMERETPGEQCVRQFLAENCEISPSLLDALPFLRTLEDPSFQLSQDFRKTSVFRHFLIVLQELSVSDATCEQSFRQLSRRGGSGGALQPKCQQRAQQLCIHRFEANIPWKEWEEVLSVAFRGAGPKLTYTSWAVACRRTMRIVRLIITLRLAR
ncbi:unnamed protein product [Durusdinium trenchii]|uniref:Uncharacterized protein n=1 Tax=Durusdinium trenchii TaxID=1381693 RepID=A0ABP0PCL3_9DINO